MTHVFIFLYSIKQDNEISSRIELIAQLFLKLIQCEQCARIQVFSDSHFPVKRQNRRFSPYTGKYRSVKLILAYFTQCNINTNRSPVFYFRTCPFCVLSIKVNFVQCPLKSSKSIHIIFKKIRMFISCKLFFSLPLHKVCSNYKILVF